MKNIRKNTRVASLLFLTITLMMISVKSSIAVGKYEVNSLSQISGTQKAATTAGEPAALAIAIAVGAAFIFAAGVAFVVGVVAGTQHGQTMINLDGFEKYNPTDFSSFDIG